MMIKGFFWRISSSYQHKDYTRALIDGMFWWVIDAN